MASTIALIAHDGKKDDMARFAQAHKRAPSRFRMFA
jgi:methylglyoxal synthase